MGRLIPLPGGGRDCETVCFAKSEAHWLKVENRRLYWFVAGLFLYSLITTSLLIFR